MYLYSLIQNGSLRELTGGLTMCCVDFPDNYFMVRPARARAVHDDEYGEVFHVDRYGCEVQIEDEEED